MLSRNMWFLVATLFGVIIFLSKIFLPTPIDKMFIIFQALLLALSSLMVGKFGATYSALIDGLLITILRTPLAPFSLVFSLVYGLTIDAFFHAFKVKEGGNVKTARSIAALTLSTTLTGISSMYVTVMLGLVPMMPTLYLIITLAGILNGALAGYLTSIIWNKYLIRYFETR